MNEPPPITDAEWKIMNCLWEKSPLSAYDLIEVLSKSEEWHANTVRTLLARLVSKGVLETESYKNLYLYRPTIGREVYVRAEADGFLQKVFGGALKHLLAHFAERESLTEAEVKELKRILDQRGGGKR